MFGLLVRKVFYWLPFLLSIPLICVPASAVTCSPIQGLGSIQLFNQNGIPIPSGVLYSYQAGTSTQQSTFTDSTCLVANNNPITLTTGGRANIWLTTSATYKFVACIQNDGASCAPADVLFSVDNVPGGPQTGGSPFIGTFISGSANPASTGILELASPDSICWRNQANTINLCLSKDTSDVLGWNGGDMKFTETSCSATAAGFDYICASAAQHRWTMFNNGGSLQQIVGAGVDINTSDQVTQLHFGSQATPLSSVALTTGQLLQWDGAHISGGIAVSGTPTSGQVLTATSGTAATWSTPTNNILLHANTTTIVNGTIPNSNTTVFSKAITMPAAGCPCRILASYSLYITTTNAGVQAAMVSDGTNNWAGSVSNETGSVGTIGVGQTGVGTSPVTYANNANVTVTVVAASTATGSATVNSGVGASLTGAPASQLVLDVIPSN